MTITANHNPGPWWLVVLAGATVLVVLATRPAQHATAQALGGPETAAMGRLMVVPLQAGPNLEVLAVIDQDNATLCIYQYQPRSEPHERLALLAARSLRYDLQLEALNTADPQPHEVQALIQPPAALPGRKDDNAVESAPTPPENDS